MGQRIAIKSLIKERKGSAREAASETDRLPAAIAESIPLWNIVAERAGQVLSTLLDSELTADVELSIATHAQMRKTASDPGVLVFLDPPDKQAFVRFPGNDAQVLTAFLLRASDIMHPDDLPPEDLDGLVTATVIEAVSGLIYAAFGIPLRLPQKLAFQLVWPLTPPPPEPRLYVVFKLKFASGETAEVQILFRDTREPVFQELIDKRDQSIDLKALTIPVTGVLSRWTSDAIDLAQIEPGLRITIPGGDLNSVAIEAEGRSGGMQIAKAELGTAKGRHALKVSEIAERR